jgi:hypothetical protein
MGNAFIKKITLKLYYALSHSVYGALSLMDALDKPSSRT